MDLNDLLYRAEVFTERFEYELAINCYKAALSISPDNCQVIDDLTDVLLDAGHIEEAKIFLRKSIDIAPLENPGKYLSLAQHLQGHEAIALSKRGIELLVQQKNEGRYSSQQELRDLNQQISSAYTSVAEIYLTDSCFDDDAEDNCERLLQEAVKHDPNNPEAYQVYASFKISQSNPEEALKHLKRSHEIWRNSEEKPLYTFRLTTTKLYIELEDFESALEVVLDLLHEIDTNPEVWYLCGLCQNATNKPSLAEESLNKALELLAIEEREGKKDEANLRGSAQELLEAVIKAKEQVIESDDEVEDNVDMASDDDEVGPSHHDQIR